MLPDKTTRCHRTGFAKTCFECVTEHGCRMWKRVTLEHHPETGAASVDHYDCMDSMADLYWKDMLRRQVQTTASVNGLTNEVHHANSSGMAHAMTGIRSILSQRHDVTAPQIAHDDVVPQKLLEG